MIPLIVVGLTGRMGRRVAALSAADPLKRTTVLAGIVARDDPGVGSSVEGAPVVDSFDKAACFATAGVEGRVVVVDFSRPEGLRAILAAAADRGFGVVSGTTGLSDADRAALADAAKTIPVLWAPNMSLGVHVLEKLVAEAARAFGGTAEVEIEETHHRHKTDAPSGTAKRLAEIVAKESGQGAGSSIVSGRSGIAKGDRPSSEIAIHSLRMGEVVGEHAVHFALDHEIVTLSHRALSRDVFASGALAAARWVAGAKPGLYGMGDVIGK